MKIASANSELPSTSEAIRQAFADLQRRLDGPLHFLLVHFSVYYDPRIIFEELRKLAPGIPIHGGSTCQSVMTERGFSSAEGIRALGLFGISDPNGAYGTGIADVGQDPAQAAILATKEALSQAKRTGESPPVVWMTCVPGAEEEVITGVSDFFGPNVPIYGGTSADDDVSGKWSQFSHKELHRNSIVISVLFPTAAVAGAFQGGYKPTEKSAIITSGHGNTIHELDGRPAAEVYNSWIGGGLEDRLGKHSPVHLETSLQPLGRIAGELGGIPYFQLSHPQSFTAERGLTLFTKIKKGERIYLMRGTADAIVERPRRVIENAIRNSSSAEAVPIGALVVYCAGCMVTVKERMGEVTENFSAALGKDTPFLGGFAFGEQGCFFGGENRHGNLMISVLLFLK